MKKLESLLLLTVILLCTAFGLASTLPHAAMPMSAPPQACPCGPSCDCEPACRCEEAKP